MYHYWSFKGIDALVSAGLGGGSLIYANVFIRKDEHWFVHEDLDDGGYEYWPVNRADLDPHYDRVEQMIGLQRFPFEHEPYASTPKTIAFKEAADKLGLEHFHPKLAVTFANEGRPPVPGRGDRRGAPEPSRAHAHDLPDVRGVRRRLQLRRQEHARLQLPHARQAPGRRDPHAVRRAPLRAARRRRLPRPLRGPGRRRAREAPPTVDLTCDHLVLSAGTLGTTNLLLRNRAALPAAVAQDRHALLRQRRPADAGAQHEPGHVDGKREPRIVDPGYGPVITTHGAHPRRARTAATGRGFYLQDAGYPQHLAWVLHAVSAPGAGLALAQGGLLPGQELAEGHAGHRRDRADRRADAARRAVGGRAAAARDGPRHPRRADVPAQRPARPRLDARGVRRRTSSACATISRDVARVARRPVRGQPAVVPAAGHHRPPAGRRADGPPSRRGRGRRLRQRVRLSRPAHRRRLGDARARPGPNPSFTIAALADRFADQIIEPDRRAAEAAAT